MRKPTNDNEVTRDNHTDDNHVKVWISQTGSKYHNNPNCSNMKNPSYVSLEWAQSHGREPCKKCY